MCYNAYMALVDQQWPLYCWPQDIMRALFIFAKLNSGVRYVHGMNEVYAPLYFVFKTDRDTSWSDHAEGDAFFCYVELLTDFRDNFCKSLV